MIDTRWPELTLDAALPRLHKAAHYARLAVERRTAVVLGLLVPAAPNPPGPWAQTLAGRWEQAATAWAALGERHEQAVVLATAREKAAQARRLRLLDELGAVATIPAV